MEQLPTIADFKSFAPRPLGDEYPLWLSSRVGKIALLSGALESSMRLLLRSMLRDLGAEGTASIVKKMAHDAVCAKASELASSSTMRRSLGDELADWIVATAAEARNIGSRRNRFMHAELTPVPGIDGTWAWHFSKEWIVEETPIAAEDLDLLIHELEVLISQSGYAMQRVMLTLAGPSQGIVPLFPEQME